MKTVFDDSIREELIQRINSLTENSKPVWGKMDVYQMARHNTIWNDWVLGNGCFTYKQDFIGKIFGKMALKSNTKDDRQITKNVPTGKAFTVKETVGNLPSLKLIWTVQISSYEDFSNDAFIHDFFGKMSKDQIGIFAYKHNDHHLRQFKV